MMNFALRGNRENDALWDMEWDWQNRRLTLSVGELSRFSLVSGGEEASGRWRAELGTHWHTVLRERTEAGEPGWVFERPVKGSLLQENWHFALTGRVDQLRPGPESPLLREVKTVSIPLPADEDFLREQYPNYFHQALLYAFLLAREGPFPETELLFLEIASGATQTVKLGNADLEELHEHLRMVANVLEERRSHFSRLRRLAIPKPFPAWREGQPEVREALSKALEEPLPILLEAPTGFGKTGIVLEQALHALAAGKIERILLLTGKNTGHSPLLDQLQAFKEAAPELTLHAMRSRRDHALDPGTEEAFTHAEIRQRWLDSGLSAPALLRDGVLFLEDVRALGQRHGIPPWALTRLLMPYADIWVADFNYLFDPGVAQVLENIPTYAPERTLLVVDEAHNLPERAAASRSHFLDAATIAKVHTEVQLARFPGKLERLLDQLRTMVRKQMPADSLDPPFEADLFGLLRELDSALRESSFGEDEITPESWDWLWEIPAILADWDHPDIPIHSYSPRKGSVHLACLDAAKVVYPVLRRFNASILMSATLRPWDAFRTAIGINQETNARCIQGTAPWLEGCFEVLVDARVDTRYRHRERYMDTTAETIGATANAGKGCTAVFFPSYRYAEQVMERLQFLHPELRCEVQQRDLNLEEQQAFLESALIFDDVLFLILGSRFSEGIDAIGGKIGQAIVVSPALPEVNGLQRAREARVPGGSNAAFRTIYQIPGMRKISQALGRLVRSPEQSARVLLHGKRFMEPGHQDLLPEYLQPVGHIVTDGELLRKWIERLQ